MTAPALDADTAQRTRGTGPARGIHWFRAIWPIVDESVPLAQLIDEAREDLRLVAARAHAAPIAGLGRFSIAKACDVPGSGQVTDAVLLFEAPAQPAPARPYHRRRAA